MSNRIQLRRTSTPGKVPTTDDLLDGELSLNLADQQMYVRMGVDVLHVNHANFIVQDATHRFVTDAQITAWGTGFTLEPATALLLGGVKIGQNITVEADGTIHIPDASGTTSGILTATDWSTFNGKQAALGFTPVNKAGDTMTGALVLPGAPTNANEATTKTYVDDGLMAKLNLTGGTLSGALVLAADPVANLEAATKQYVDSGFNIISGRYAAPVADLTALAALVSTTLDDRQLRLVESNGTIYRYDVQATDVADGIGVIVPADVTEPAPGRWFKVQAATQNHNLLIGLQGGAANDYLHLTTAEKNGYDSHVVDASVHLTSAQNTWIDAINASSTEVNYLVGVTGLIQGQLDGKQASLGFTPVNVAGDTMTGALVLSGDPTLALHAATKQYVDNATIDGGTF